MQLVSSNWRDIQKYYDQCFIKIRDFGDKIFFVDKVTPEFVLFKDKDGQGGKIKSRQTKKKKEEKGQKTRNRED